MSPVLTVLQAFYYQAVPVEFNHDRVVLEVANDYANELKMELETLLKKEIVFRFRNEQDIEVSLDKMRRSELILA